MTLAELLVAMFVMGIAMAIFGSVLSSVQRGVVTQESLNRTLEDARLAVQQLDREIRSGNVLYNPALEGNVQPSCTGCEAGFTLRIATQSNASSDIRAGNTCVLWQIDDQQRLLTRRWPEGKPTQATAWRVVATGVVNRALGETAFAIDTDVLKGGRTLNITLALNEDLGGRPGQTVRIRAALTGRNTSYDYPTNVCSTTPA
jgi:type II secretory pathway pseudopilin PulG